MALGAGQRDRKIVIERATDGVDEHGDAALVWAEHAAEWASVRYGTSAERRASAQTGADQAATFGVLWNSRTREVTPKDRIQLDGATWNITGVAPSPRNTGMVFAAVRAAS